ncbi:hypothetical protein KUTeg_009761 [Tegillarca granosa]|uniref:Uncharacterized protein n=1 Tax=Tegillarca granosa TaxID=220873 RepID=A0ABQ9F9V3_TEGGR|nr:hypothetical protein KUTeg_009761 [Tegillarca granosa]
MKTVLGLLALVAVASAMDGMGGMFAGLQGLMGEGMKDMLGGGGIGDLLKNAPAMLKNLKREDIEAAIKNMPPELREMAEGMGISKEQIENAVDNLPQMVSQFETPEGEIDTDKIKNNVRGMLEGEISKMGMDPAKMQQEVQVMMPRIKETLVQKAKDMGIDYKEGDDLQTLMPQIKTAAIRELKNSGVDIDLEDPEASMEKIKGQMKELIGVNADDDEEEIKSKVTKNVLNKMRSQGYNVDPEKPQESMKKMLDMARDRAGKSLGIEINDQTSQEEIREKIMDKLESQGIPCKDKAKLMKFVMKKLMGGFMSRMMGGGRPPMMPMPRPQPQQMPMPMPRPQMPMRPQQPSIPMNLNLEINVEEGDRPTNINMGGHARSQPSGVIAPEYVHGAKDALVNAFDDQEVIRHVMAVEYGIKNGVVSEEAITEVLQDLLHYRLMAKVLINKNHMLEHRLGMSAIPQVVDRPVMARSPILRALLAGKF